MLQYETFELVFKGQPLAKNYAQIDLQAEFHFVNSEGQSALGRIVRGFYDGEDEEGRGIYKIRFLPEQTGQWDWTVRGLFEESGEELCTPAVPSGPSAYTAESACGSHSGTPSHGRVIVRGEHFEYDDGTLFVPFGTTVYALAHQDDAVVEETLATLAASPFNKVRMCVFPKSYVYNQNEPPYYPFSRNPDGSWDASSPCIAFWHRFEKILDRLEHMNIQIDLILFHPYDRWGFESLSMEENIRYLSYLLARLSARPGIWWSLANEYDVCPDKTMDDWYTLEAYVSEHDPFHHLLSCHNCFPIYDASRPGITHASVQSKNLARVAELREKFHKPVIIDECGYEGNLPEFFGCLSAYEMTARMWRAFVTGGYCMHGETFLDESGNDVIWWAKGGTLKGKSPERIAFLRKIAAELPGPVDPIPNRMLLAAYPENRERARAALPYLPREQQGIVRGILMLDPAEVPRMSDAEMLYNGHIGEDVYLTFYDLRCSAKDIMELPKDKLYDIELIDVMAMTREVVLQHVSGPAVISLPGHEGMLAIARRCG